MRLISKIAFSFLICFAFLCAFHLCAEKISEPEPSDAYATQNPPGNKPFFHPPGMDDRHRFINNINDKPIISLRALIRLIQTTESNEGREKVLEILQNSIPHIVQLMASIERLKKQGAISSETYAQINSILSPYGISPAQLIAASADNSRSRSPIISAMRVRRNLDRGKKDEAEKEVRNLEERHSDNPSALSAAAQYYNELKKFDKAEETASKAIKLNPSSVDAYKTRAVARISIKDRKGAIEDIEKALRLDPQDESAKILSLLIQSQKEAPDLKTVSSINEMKKALGNIPIEDYGVQAASSNFGELKPQEKSPSSKITLKTTAPANYSKSRAFLKTAIAKNRIGDFSGAIKYATLAIKNDPDNINAYLERAVSHNFTGNYTQAIRDATKVLSKDPSNISALNVRSWALNKLGNYKSAREDASRAIEINPNYADAWFNKAVAMENMGKYKEMLDNYQKAAMLSKVYKRYYQDAVAQYSPKIPGYHSEPSLLKDNIMLSPKKSPLKRFLILMIFTITGGLLIGLGFMHMMGGKTTMEPAPASGVITNREEISPSVFYEGITSGKYKIVRKLGEGGMGIVYEAIDQSLGRKVALKKMNDEIKVSETEKQRFLQEARMVALLHHPNIIEIYTIFEENQDIYLVLEYVEGQTLNEILDREIRIPYERAQNIFLQIASSLSYAHSKNIVHRDLKLSNIMISNEGEVKITDFGLALKAMESISKTKEIVGSPAYMAPEQEKGKSGKLSDIFSLGVCFYESLSGNLPFQGPDFHRQKMQKKFIPLSATVVALPGGIDKFIEKSLEPDPANRFQTIDEWKESLSRLT